MCFVLSLSVIATLAPVTLGASITLPNKATFTIVSNKITYYALDIVMRKWSTTKTFKDYIKDKDLVRGIARSPKYNVVERLFYSFYLREAI
jgi:hypothetical protein